MRTFPLIALLLLSTVSFAQKKIEISEGATAFPTGSQNALSFVIYNGDIKEVGKAWERQLKDLKGKVSVKDIYFADDCHAKSMGENNFDIYSKVEVAMGEGVRVHAAFDLGGAYMTSATHPDKFLAAKILLYNFAVEQNKEAVKGEIRLAQKVVSDKESELSDLDKSTSKLQDEILDHQRKIEGIKGEIAIIEQQKTVKRMEIEAQKGVVKGLDDKMKAVN